MTASRKPQPEVSGGGKMAHASVLVLDDEPGMRNFLSKILTPRVKRLETAPSPEEATRLLDESFFDLVILDNIMPGMSGLDWIADQHRRGFFADTIMITAYADLETAITALRRGVSDFVLKPFKANQILNAIERTLDRTFLLRDNALMRRELGYAERQSQMVGSSPPMADLRQLLDKLAPLPTPVLFTGASGTGKEVAARNLHQMSDRANRPFVAVNCAAVAAERIAVELFGQVDVDDKLRPGLLLLAEGGTLLLDEVGQMPDQMQAALLRVLEDGRVRPVGAKREIPLNLRFLFATNADLDAEVASGSFRADLYHRINIVQVDLPLLKDRGDDVVELAAMFMRQFSLALGLPALDMNEETLLKLRRYDWPGNVRELRNLIERSVILGELPEQFEGRGETTGSQAALRMEFVMQRHMMHVLDMCGGNRAEAARKLGVSRKTIDRKMAGWTG